MEVGNYYGNNDETNMLVTLENELHAYICKPSTWVHYYY